MLLADYLIDHGPQKYGRGLGWLIEKLADNKRESMASYLYEQNKDLVHKYLAEDLIEILKQFKDEFSYTPIVDKFEPLTESNESVYYLAQPKNMETLFIDSEEGLEKLTKLILDDTVIGIDLEWRPNMNVFHQT